MMVPQRRPPGICWWTYPLTSWTLPTGTFPLSESEAFETMAVDLPEIIDSDVPRLMVLKDDGCAPIVLRPSHQATRGCGDRTAVSGNRLLGGGL